MNKRWICTILAALMALSLTACGEKKEEAAREEPQQVGETADAPEAEAPEEVPAESEEEPVPEEDVSENTVSPTVPTEAIRRRRSLLFRELYSRRFLYFDLR